MLYNNSFRINFNRLAVLLLPTFLRKPLIIAFLHAAYSQITALYLLLLNYRNTKNYRLTHNGQVCYLRAVLNDYFDNEQRRIEIDDGMEAVSMVVYWREVRRLVGAPHRESNTALIIGWWGTAVDGAYDFSVRVPPELYADSTTMTKIAALVREYKLASKQFTIIPL
jgi:hypothetical protein